MVVKTDNECRLAAAVLGFTYVHNPMMSQNRPAGCYAVSTSGVETVYLNSIDDVSMTIPTQFSRGICRGGIIINIIFFSNLSSIIMGYISRYINHPRFLLNIQKTMNNGICGYRQEIRQSMAGSKM